MNQGTQPYSAKPTGANGARSWLRPAIATGVLVVFVPLFISAGFWQLGRADEKKAIEAAFQANTEMEVMQQPIADAEAVTQRYRTLQLEGRFDPHHQVLLDNIVQDGVNGYEVLTPFRTYNRTIMVNRGWIAANPDRRIVPTVEVDGELRTVTGIVDTFPAPGIRIATDYPADAPWPRRMLYPTQETLAANLATPIATYQLLMAEDQPDGYARTLKSLDLGISTHYGYAFQWFSFTLITLIFYVILMTRWRKEHQPPKGPTP